MIIICFVLLHWYLSAFSQTFFLHRYASHRMFEMPIFWQRFFYVITFLTQGTSYLNPRTYALLHRMHHAHSDTEKDPHSPHFYRNPLSMMRGTLFMYLDIFSGKVKPKLVSEENYPQWPAFDRWADGWQPRVFFAAAYTAFYVCFASDPWMYIFLPLHFVMGPVHGAIVNWCGHKYGYSNYNNHDQSRNTIFFDIVTMGELMQNNHHQDPKRCNFARQWFEFDPTYPLIRLLSRLGIVQSSPK